MLPNLLTICSIASPIVKGSIGTDVLELIEDNDETYSLSRIS